MDKVNDSCYPMSDAQILRAAEAILLRHVGGREQLADPLAAGRALQARIALYEHEVFTCIFLDTRHGVIAIEELFRGTVDGCEVHPREVAKRALQLNASALIIGHNHPSQNSEPSAADRAVTARLKQALALIEVRLLDHFVVVPGQAPVSMAARGWI